MTATLTAQSTNVVGIRRSDKGWIAAWWQRGPQDRWRLTGVTIGHPNPNAAIASFTQAAELSVSDKLEEEQEQLLDRLRDVVHGQMDTLADVELNLDHLGPFTRKVIQRCRKIPAGKTMTYGELAAACGSPNAARAVGNAMATNRFPLIIPCHRVVGSGGCLGGFSAPQGIELKRQLLQREGAKI